VVAAYTLLIAGERVRAADHAEILNPSTGELVGLLPLATQDDLNAAVSAAR
jgi:acyl-CoA reductase-like NAD-dependent aldehyde dehydrogenase